MEYKKAVELCKKFFGKEAVFDGGTDAVVTVVKDGKKKFLSFRNYHGGPTSYRVMNEGDKDAPEFDYWAGSRLSTLPSAITVMMGERKYFSQEESNVQMEVWQQFRGVGLKEEFRIEIVVVPIPGQCRQQRWDFRTDGKAGSKEVRDQARRLAKVTFSHPEGWMALADYIMENIAPEKSPY